MKAHFKNSALSRLYEVSIEIGLLAEEDSRYSAVYDVLEEALDTAEDEGLIAYGEELDEEAE